MQTFICQSTFSSIFTSVVSFVKLLRSFPVFFFVWEGHDSELRWVYKNEQGNLWQCLIPVSSRPLLLQACSAFSQQIHGILWLIPWTMHILVSSSCMSQRVKELSFVKKQLKVRRDFISCFLPLLFHWSVPAYPRDLLPVLQDCIKVWYEEQHPPFEVLFSMLLEQCDEFPGDWQKISKWNNA